MNAPRPLWLPLWLLPAALAALADGPVAAQIAACRLCGAPADTTDQPVRRTLTVTVQGSLEFGRLAQRGWTGGSALLNPDGTTSATDSGLTDLGGVRYAAEVTLNGEPGTRVRVGWPDRLILRSADGGQVTLRDIRSDVPPVLLLDSAGRARFGLGARLEVLGGASGAFRGRIPIDAEYE